MRDLFVSPGEDLQAALDAAGPGDRVCLAPGEYRGKFLIHSPGITLAGCGMEESRIVWEDYAEKPHPVGGVYNTFRTYTLAVLADGVTVNNLAVINASGSPERKGQEVALSVCADAFRMESCLLRSTQDTLFSGPLPDDLIGRYEGFLIDPLRRGGRMRQLFRNCRIEGTVDFIFGCGETLFDSCELRSLRDARNCGYVAAPAHELRQKAGFRFVSCRFTREAGVADASVFLARPWRDHGLCRFENCSYEAHIAPEGFDRWNDTRRDRTARFYESPAVPGRVPWVKI